MFAVVGMVYLCANKTNSSKPTKHNFNAKKYFACGERKKLFSTLDVIAIIHHNTRASHFGKLIASFCDAKNSFWQTLAWNDVTKETKECVKMASIQNSILINVYMSSWIKWFWYLPKSLYYWNFLFRFHASLKYYVLIITNVEHIIYS